MLDEPPVVTGGRDGLTVRPRRSLMGEAPLSAAQCEAFESQGFILQHDVLSPRELADARATWCEPLSSTTPTLPPLSARPAAADAKGPDY